MLPVYFVSIRTVKRTGLRVDPCLIPARVASQLCDSLHHAPVTVCTKNLRNDKCLVVADADAADATDANVDAVDDVDAEYDVDAANCDVTFDIVTATVDVTLEDLACSYSS